MEWEITAFSSQEIHPFVRGWRNRSVAYKYGFGGEVYL